MTGTFRRWLSVLLALLLVMTPLSTSLADEVTGEVVEQEDSGAPAQAEPEPQVTEAPAAAEAPAPEPEPEVTEAPVATEAPAPDPTQADTQPSEDFNEPSTDAPADTPTDAPTEAPTEEPTPTPTAEPTPTPAPTFDHYDLSGLQETYTVAYGASLSEVLSLLPTTLTAVYSDDSTQSVAVTWTCVSGSYEPNSLQFDREFRFEATVTGASNGTIASTIVKYDQSTITNHPDIAVSAGARTITITGQVTTDDIVKETGYSADYSVIVESNGSITGGTVVIPNSVQNHGIISGGSFSGRVTNENTLSGGTFTGNVYNHGKMTNGASITGGGKLMENTGTVTTDGIVVDDAARTVTISSGYSFTTDQIALAIGSGKHSYVIINDGTISGGSATLSNPINTGRGDRSSSDSRRSGYIYGGSFSGEVYANTISGGSFSGRTHAFTISGGTFNGFVGDAPNGLYALTISGGTFNGEVGTTDDAIIIHGGTFAKAVNAYNLGVRGNATFNGSVFFTVGDIRSGTFKGQVTNNGCSISGGTFDGKVINNATIHGGTFNGSIENRGTIRSTGEFKYAVGTPTRDAEGNITHWDITIHSLALQDAYLNCPVVNFGSIEVSATIGPNFSVSGSGSCSVPALMASTDGTYTERRVNYGANVINTLHSIAPAKRWTYASGASIPSNATFSLNAMQNTFVGDESYTVENGVLIVNVPLGVAPTVSYTSVRVDASGSITGGNWTAPVSVNGGSITGGTFKNLTVSSGSVTGATINGEINISGGTISGCSFGVALGAVVRSKTGGEIKLSITANGTSRSVSYGDKVKTTLQSFSNPEMYDWYRVSSPSSYIVEDGDTFRLSDNGASYTLVERKHPPILWPESATVVVGLPLSHATYTAKDSNGVFSWENGAVIPPKGTNSYTLVYTPHNTKDYKYTTAECRKLIPVTAQGQSVTIAINNVTKAYGMVEPRLTAKVTGVKSGDHINYSLSREPGQDVGTYNITATLGDNPGYEVTVVPGTFTIEPRSIASNLNNSTLGRTFPYTGDAITPDPQISITEKILVKGTDYTATYENNVNAGRGTIHMHGINNYKDDLTLYFTITKGSAVVQINNVTKTYGDADPAFTATVTGVGSSEHIDYTLSRVAGENAGKYTISGEPGQNDNFYVSVLSGTLTIQPKELPGVIASPADQPYNGAALTPKVTVMDGSKTLVEGTDYSLSYNNNVNVGTGTITVTGKGNYTGTRSVSFTITKGNATITANAASKVAGEKDPPLTATVTGVSGKDKLNYTLARESGETPGTYAITVTPGSNPNYNVTTQGGTFTIGSKALPSTITVTAQTYTGSALTPKPVVKDGSKTLTEGVDYELSYSKNVNVGTATVTLAGRDNYAGMRSVNFAINRAPATITVNAASKIFGEGDPVFSAQVSGELAGEQLNYTIERTRGESVGSYTISAKPGSNPNYDVHCVSAQLTIEPKQLPAGVTAPENQTYSGSAQTPKPVVRDGATTLIENVDYALSYENNVNAGMASVTITGRGNYTGSRSTTFYIDRASATIAANAVSKSFGENDPALTASVTGEKGRDKLSYSLKRETGEAVGEYAINVTAIDNPNYDIHTVAGVFTIAQHSVPSTITIPAQTYTGYALTPKPLVMDGSETLTEGEDYTLRYANNVDAGAASVTVTGINNYAGTRTVNFTIQGAPATITVTAARKTYGEADPQFQASVSGTLNGDALNYQLERRPGEDAGEYAITAVPGQNPNYAVNVVEANLTIEPKALAAQVRTGEQTYAGGPIQAKPTVTEGEKTLVEGTDYELSYQNNVNVGTASVTVTGKGNYKGSVSGSFDIVPAEATIAADNLRKSYGTADPELTATVTGAQGSDQLNYSLEREPGDEVGEYAIHVTAGSNPNYSVTTTEGTFTVTAEAITVQAAIEPQTYTGKALTPKPALKAGRSVLNEGTDYELTYKDNINAGTATVTLTGLGNYSGSQELHFTINPAPASIAAQPAHKTYGAGDPKLSATVSGTLGKDTLQYSVEREAGENAGEYTIQVKLGENPNYDVQTTSATFTIEPKQLPQPNPVEPQTYAGKALEPTPVVKDGTATLAAGTDFELSYDNNVNVGTASVTVTGKGNYTGTHKLNFQIVKREATVAADALHKTYGSADPELTATVSGTVGDDTLNYSLERKPGEEVGAYAITVTLLENPNYAPVAQGADFTIDPKPVPAGEALAAMTYTGEQLMPKPVVKDGEKLLTEGKDYELGYQSNVNAGTATVTIAGKGNYGGTQTVNFTIEARQLPDQIEVEAQTYAGKGIEAKPTVMDGATTLREGVDYKLSYENNRDVGTATVTVTGIGNYKGEQQASFEIEPRPVSIAADALSKIYGSEDPTLTATVKDAAEGDTLNYRVEREAGEDVGEYAVTVTALENPNYVAWTSGATFTIEPRQIPAIGALEAQTYTAGALEPKPEVLDGEKLLIEGTDYELSYQNNVNVGTASVTVTGKGNYCGAQSQTFEIEPAQATIRVNDVVKSIGEDDPELTAEVEGTLGEDRLNYELEREPGEDLGDYNITARPGDNPNYEVSVVDGTFSIVPLPTGVKFETETFTLYVGETAELKATLEPANAESELKYASENEGVASVDESGTVTALHAGVTELTVRTENDKTASCTLTVLPVVQELTIGVKDKIKLVPDVEPGVQCTFESDAPTIASVGPKGMATAKAKGSATITASVDGVKMGEWKLTITKAPSKISLDHSKATLGVGETLKLTATTDAAPDSTLNWSSSDAKIASVADGLVTAHKTGIIKITVKTYDGKHSATCMVTVNKAPTSVKLSLESVTLGSGDSAAIAVTLSKSSSSAITWTSSEESVAKVEGGKIVAGEPGSATLTAETFNGKSASCQVEVKLAPERIELGEDITLGAKETATLSPTLDEGTAASLSYENSNEKAATVNAKGKITAVKAGTATITVKTHNGVSDSITVTVVKAPSKVTISKAKATLGVNETLQLSATPDSAAHAKLSWSTNKPGVASVDENGLVTAKKAGTAKITVTTYNGKTASCTVTVSKAPTSIKLSDSEMTLGSADSKGLSATLSKGSAGAIEWSSSDETVARYEGGKVIAGEPGTATLTATTYNGQSASCTVTVLPTPDSVELPETQKVQVKKTLKLKPVLPEGTAATLSYKSSNVKVATVNANGKVTGVKAGKATITVTDHTGKVLATCEITVTK